MSQSVPAAIVGLGVILILIGVAAHATVNVLGDLDAYGQSASDTGKHNGILGQANLMIAGGTGSLLFGAWLYYKTR